MSDIKSSLDKIKNIPKDPMIYHKRIQDSSRI